MLCNIVKRWVNHIKICGQNINRRKRKLVATKTWGTIMIDTYPFLSTIFIYNNQTVKVRLYCKLTRDVLIYEFSSKQNIIDDHMLYLQSRQHTKKGLKEKGYIHVKY